MKSSSNKNSPHLGAAVSLVAVEMHLVVRERHLHTLHLVLELLEMGALLHECIVMQCFVDEPHEDVHGLFVGVCEIFDAQHDLEGCVEENETNSIKY